MKSCKCGEELTKLFTIVKHLPFEFMEIYHCRKCGRLYNKERGRVDLYEPEPLCEENDLDYVKHLPVEVSEP